MFISLVRENTVTIFFLILAHDLFNSFTHSLWLPGYPKHTKKNRGLIFHGERFELTNQHNQLAPNMIRISLPLVLQKCPFNLHVNINPYDALVIGKDKIIWFRQVISRDTTVSCRLGLYFPITFYCILLSKLFKTAVVRDQTCIK